MLTPAEFAWQELINEKRLPRVQNSAIRFVRQGRSWAYARVLQVVPGKFYGEPDKIINQAYKAARRLDMSSLPPSF